MNKNTILVSLFFLLTGFISAYFVLQQPQKQKDETTLADNNNFETSANNTVTNPFSTIDKRNDDNISKNKRLSALEDDVRLLQQQVQAMDQTLQKLSKDSTSGAVLSQTSRKNPNRRASALTQRLYNLDNLIRGGIEPSQAENIVRRKNAIELKRLALQDRATRDNYLNTEKYFNELSEINKQDITLREELGDQDYDEYLYDSKQNNRIRISSVMLGSAAEQAGIQKGDVVLSYDSNRMFTWQELKDATSQGKLGDYVSISIYRNGEIYSFSVPRGPLGMQLGATRLRP